MKTNTLSFSTALLGLGSLTAFLLMATRVCHVISFTTVNHVITSGYEEESLFALWKYLHGFSVYSDPHQIPYCASYFNWLFYAVYGTATTFIIHTFHLNEAFIPTVGRVITLGIVMLGFWLNYRLFVKGGGSRLPTLLALSLSALLWFGPLLGYWAMTVRPDLLGLLFDLCAIYVFLSYLPDRSKWMLSALFCYLSWATKQINIVMPLTLLLYLLLERNWRAAMLFSVVLGIGYTVTFWFANSHLINTLLFMNTAIPLSTEVWLENLFSFFKKTAPVWILFFGIATYTFYHKESARVLADKKVRLSLCGLLAWSLILLPASSKHGSSDNYHFIALFFLLLGVAGALGQLKPQKSGALNTMVALSGITLIVSIFFAFQNASMANLQKQHAENTTLMQCFAQLKQPLFIANHYAALPWVNKSPIPFVLAYNYWDDRRAHRDFEKDGIGGLIQSGYFKTLILPNWVRGTFDGASLSSYRQKGECAGYSVFVMKEEA